MLGHRMAMQKLQQMDEGYAQAIGNLLSGRQGGQVAMAGNPYVAGMASPAGAIQEVRQQVRQQDVPQDQRDRELREVLAMEMGAAGRYGIPAAGIGLGAAGIGAIAGGQPVTPAAQPVIDYDSPAHGSNLSPESHAIYKEVHQGLMNGTVSSEELRAAVRSGQFDHDPALVNHFLDVMG